MPSRSAPEDLRRWHRVLQGGGDGAGPLLDDAFRAAEQLTQNAEVEQALEVREDLRSLAKIHGYCIGCLLERMSLQRAEPACLPCLPLPYAQVMSDSLSDAAVFKAPITLDELAFDLWALTDGGCWEHEESEGDYKTWVISARQMIDGMNLVKWVFFFLTSLLCAYVHSYPYFRIHRRLLGSAPHDGAEAEASVAATVRSMKLAACERLLAAPRGEDQAEAALKLLPYGMVALQKLVRQAGLEGAAFSVRGPSGVLGAAGPDDLRGLMALVLRGAVVLQPVAGASDAAPNEDGDKVRI